MKRCQQRMGDEWSRRGCLPAPFPRLALSQGKGQLVPLMSCLPPPGAGVNDWQLWTLPDPLCSGVEGGKVSCMSRHF